MDAQRARELLEAERERLLGALRGSGVEAAREQERAAAVLSPDQQVADEAQELYAREQDESIRQRLERDLDEVAHALRKVEDGTYGLDEISGEPIPDERLEARPTARYTVENQERVEHREGVPNDEYMGAPNARASGDPTATSGQGRLAR